LIVAVADGGGSSCGHVMEVVVAVVSQRQQQLYHVMLQWLRGMVVMVVVAWLDGGCSR
jgi:hypothetical protein